MVPYERQQQILGYLANHEVAKLAELQELLPGISESTLRRDVKELADAGKVERLSGGAVRLIEGETDLPISFKHTLQTSEKESIARLAAAQVSEGDTVYLDPGTSCTALFSRLASMNVTIVTSNIDALRLAGPQTVAQVVVVGGAYDPDQAAVIGPIAEETLERYVFDEVFIGANGADPTFGITTHRLEEVSKKKAAISRAKRAFVLCDSTKFHKASALKACDLSEVTIISDKGDEELERLTTILWR